MEKEEVQREGQEVAGPRRWWLGQAGAARRHGMVAPKTMAALLGLAHQHLVKGVK